MNLVGNVKRAMALGLLVGFAQIASAGVISIVPNPATGDVGDSIFVDLIWDGTAAGEYIGDFDVDISYDDTIVGYVGSDIDPEFGIDSIGWFFGGDFSVAGLLDIFVVSADSVADLMANQDGLGNVFVLATLEFVGLVEGETDLLFGATVFGDEGGIGVLHTLNNGRICVGPNGCVDVPEPGSVSLLLMGLLALGARRLRRA